MRSVVTIFLMMLSCRQGSIALVALTVPPTTLDRSSTRSRSFSKFDGCSSSSSRHGIHSRRLQHHDPLETCSRRRGFSRKLGAAQSAVDIGTAKVTQMLAKSSSPCWNLAPGGITAADDCVAYADVPYLNGTIRGLVATKGIRAQQELIFLPVDRCLIADSSRSPASGALSGEERPREEKETKRELNAKLAGMLLESQALTSLQPTPTLSNQQQKRQKIPIDIVKYIESLPMLGAIPTPLQWDAEEKSSSSSSGLLGEDFPYEFMRRSVALQKERLGDLYEQWRAKAGNSRSMQDFVWAMEVVGSRAFSSDTKIATLKSKAMVLGLSLSACAALILVYQSALLGDLSAAGAATLILGSTVLALGVGADGGNVKNACSMLLPAIDSCNHSGADPSSSLSFDAFRGGFVLKAKRDITEGQQITVSYGSRDNDDLLQYFGFVELNNPFDRFVVLHASDKILSAAATASGGPSNLDTNENTPSKKLTGKHRDIISVTAGPYTSWKLKALSKIDRNPQESKEFKRTLLKVLSQERELFVSRVGKYIAAHIDCDSDSGSSSVDQGVQDLLRAFFSEKQRVLDAAIVILQTETC